MTPVPLYSSLLKYSFCPSRLLIRTWYFLPDQEILNALLSQAENGVEVTVLFSHRTRAPFIDIINKIMSDKLTRAGAHVYRYKTRYMHAKEAWNDKGNILFGSANVDRWALNSNFECSLQLHNLNLAQQLQQALQADLCCCQRVNWQEQFLPERQRRDYWPSW